MAPWNSRDGQTSIEILIAIVVFAVGMTASFSLMASNLQEQEFARQRQRAETLATEAVEAVRQIRTQDWLLLEPGAHGLARNGGDWEFSGTEDVTDGVFTRRVTLAELDGNRLEVDVSVDWSPRQDRDAAATRVAHLTNWRDIEVWGDWGNPAVVGSVDLGPNAEGTGVALRDQHLYITASISAGNKPSFFVADVTDPTDPTIVGSELTGTSYWDVAADPESDYVYAVGEHPDHELEVFDGVPESSPSVVSLHDLTGTGLSALLQDGFLYLGTEFGLHIFDVSTPDSPVEASYLGLGAAIEDIRVTEGLAYLASEENTEEIIIVDISDPENPVRMAGFDAGGNEDGLSIGLRKNRLYVGTEKAGGSSPELHLLNRTDPLSPALLSTIAIGGDFNAMATAGPFLYGATNISNSEFIVYRVDDAGSPTLEASLNMAQVARDLDFIENTIYITLRSNDAVQIIQPQ